MKLALVALLALSGCDSLFDIHSLEITTGSNTPDAPIIDLDAEGDSDGANCGMHDEDGDLAFDRCDKCPTISDPGDGDMDGDGVGDLCDPDKGPHNTIDAFYSFQTGAGFGSGATYPNDTMSLAGTVVSTKSFTTPERIVLAIDGVTTPGDIQLAMDPGGASQVLCELATTCMASAPSCLYGYRGATQVAALEMSIAPAQIASLSLYRTPAGDVTCSVNDTNQVHTLTITNATMPSGKLQLSAPTSPESFANLIVYNGP